MSITYPSQMENLVEAIQKLSLAKRTSEIVDIVRHAARELAGADGATFVLKDGERCYYVDEDAISPLWKGSRFPITNCVSGWAMTHRETLFIKDIYQDSRIPIDLYRPTFVKSLAMVPIRKENPLGAIGAYWAKEKVAYPEEIKLLEMLANSASIAMENVRLYEDLERQLEHRDEFLTVAAHELRTPITPLAIRIQLIQKILKDKDSNGPVDLDKVKKFVDISSRQISDIVRLLDNFIDVYRMQAGQFYIYREDGVNLNEVLERVMEQYRSLNIKIDSHLAENITGNWDQIRLYQLFHNLISNAVRYGNGLPIEVDMRKVSGGKIRVTVRDHGDGIPEELKEKIFERFERGNRSINFGGMGLGLYVSRKVVNAHGGEIWIEGKKGEGSSFIIELPFQ